MGKEDTSMVKREPLERGVFEDIEAAKRYDREARTWMRYVSKSFVSVAKRRGITGGKVLDVGTGTGLLAIEFATRLPGVEVTGLDLSDVVLELARDHVREREVPLRVQFQKGDAEDMPFEDDAFDLVISSNTLHLVENPIRVFNEIQRVLKPQGAFLISDLRRSWLGTLSRNLRAAYTPEEVRDLLNQSELPNWAVRDYLLWLSAFSGGNG
jgi:ubiquinone/menaquinone biosynthesis C-methylase UbiE